MISQEMGIKMYRKMKSIREFENKLFQIYNSQPQNRWIHLCIGEEAIAVGACTALLPNDKITSTHRCHGHVIAKGADMKKIAAEIAGLDSGYGAGKLGSQHLIDFDLGVVESSGIVGGNIPIATGVALSSKLKKEAYVTLCFFGDGASNEGTFHESLNMASLWKLPIVYICENNQFAVKVSVDKTVAVKNIAERAKGYNMPGVVVNGNDCVEVYKAVNKAVKRARKGQGPSLIECKTFSWTGHYIGDSFDTETEIIAGYWKKNDPLNILMNRYLSTYGIENCIQRIDEEINEYLESIFS